MSIADKYLSLAQYAERRGSGEPDAKYGTAEVWHIDKWKGLELWRLGPLIEEAVELGFVVRAADADQRVATAYNDGYFKGRAEGRRQGINHVATGSYEDDE